METASQKSIVLDDRHEVRVTLQGSGPDLVLIHGALTSGADWFGAPMRALEGLGRLIIVDRPGHGHSRRARFDGGPRQQAQQLRAALAKLDVRQPILVAHSLGAMVALAMAEMQPDKVAGLVLVAPLAFPEIRPLEQAIYGARSLPVVGPAWSQVMAAGPDRPVLERMHRLMFFPQAPLEEWQAHYPWAWMLSRDGGVVAGEEFGAIFPGSAQASVDFRKVVAPAEIVIGEMDGVVRPEIQAVPLAALLKDARLTRLPDTGHMLHHTRPDAVAQAVERMIDRIGG